MGNKRNGLDVLLILVMLIAVFMLFFENFGLITGNATSVGTTSNVTISSYLAIEMSPNLSSGIYFGSVDVLPAVDINATENYNETNNGTLYFINVSTDSNTAVDFCIMANSAMRTAALDEIGLGNETYAFSNSTNNGTIPDILSQTSFTLSYVSAGTGVPVGGNIYYRFWLDVPAGQATGDYNNSVLFKGVNAGSAC